MSVCLSVCLSARISPEPHARSLTNFCACCLFPWLGPPARWRYRRRQMSIWMSYQLQTVGCLLLLLLLFTGLACSRPTERSRPSRELKAVQLASRPNTKWRQHAPISHIRTVVRECCKGDDQSQWRRANFDPPATPKPLNRSSPKLAEVIMLGMSTTKQNFIQIG